MCGIAGIVSLDGSEVPSDIAYQMAVPLEHRGPDDSGDWSSALCALSHRRLSIIDLSRSGRQPLSNEDATLQLTCNGEIYNFRELRAELQQLGHHFVSDTDSEVIVHLYEEVEGDPDALLSRLDGMFAFGLWDGKRRRLLLARDRLGVKPLVYSRKAGFLLFASEAKAIFQSGLVKAKPLASAIFSYLLLRHSPAPATMYEEVDSLPSGHYLLAEVNKGVEIHKYWDIPVALSKSERIRPEKIHKLVSDAIRKRLVSDVPVGAYLSGGLDSSIVA
ncbi:MAG: asparagine synthase (glutamine-hydrolyzing), partial [Dehalococcoidia bacterium]|nr:asparagine synthase (glutamine-hydrolyzing) [Dehalococcoidia bacterium]